MSTLFFSPSTRGFYDAAIHGARTRLAQVEDGAEPREEPNPDCLIPADAVVITREEHAQLLAGQAEGNSIVGGADGRPRLEPPQARTLAQLVANAISLIDHDTDRIYLDTIGARGEEYRQAEADAQKYALANYNGPVPAFVADHQAAKGWTAKQAADDILATAGAWRNAQAQIRTNRLQCKELARQAQDEAGVQAALQQWAGFVSAVRGALGIASS